MKRIFSFIMFVMSLTQLVVASDTSVNGIYYDFNTSNGTATVTYRGAAYNSYSGEYTGSVTIPSTVTYGSNSYTVTAINAGAFYDCPLLTSVNIQANLTSIGSNAFYNCSGLLIVNIPNTVTSIGSSAFDGCDNLMYASYDNARYLSNSENTYYALIKAQSTSITSCEIHPNCNIIAGSAFEGCSSMTSVDIPAGVTNIGENAFYNCASLASVNIPSGVTSIADGTFGGCVSLSGVTIPSGVTTIGDYSFSGCSSLTDITIPNGVLTIGDNAFESCTGLTSFVIPNGVKSIGDDVFNNCSGLTSITIPTSVTDIGEFAFNGCTSLSSLTLPAYVTSVSRGTFYNCTGLSSVSIPVNVETIEDRAFQGCSSLTTIVLPEIVTAIGDYAFYGCTSLTNVNIPNGVTEIGLGTFYDCQSLTAIDIPNSVTSIGKEAFFDCIGLTSITLPNSVESVGSNAFRNCTNLSDVTCWAMTPPTCSADPRFNYTGTLLVHAESVDLYKAANYWKNFTFIEPIPGTKCHLEVVANDDSFGSTLGTGDYEYNITADIHAIPNTGYHFIKWAEDENMEKDRIVTVTSALTYTAVFAIDTFDVVVNANDDALGTVDGGGEYIYQSTATLTATPAEGHHLVEWSNGITANPYDVTVTSDTTLTAVFAIDTFTVTLTKNEDAFGTVDGAGEYTYKEVATLTATANTGYHFVRWSDGNTNASREEEITSDLDLEAVFEIDKITVTLTANDNEMGIVSGSGEYDYGTVVSIAATPNEGHHFLRWSDGNTNASKDTTVTCDVTLTAVFAVDTFTVTLTKNDDSFGTVEGAGEYTYKEIATLTATANTGYHFVRWSDGNTNASREEEITSDLDLEAVFEINRYTLNVSTDTPLYGHVSPNGSSTHDHGDLVNISATAETGYKFVSWSDGSIVANRMITMESDSDLVATFEIETYVINGVPDAAEHGSVEGGGEYEYGSTATLTATEAAGWEFVRWQDGNTDNPRSFTVTGSGTYTAIYSILSYTVNVTSGDNGTASGGGVFNYGMVTTLTATPSDHYHFVQWSDGNTDNPRALTVTSDLDLTATFAIDQITVTALSTND
ncbi:MAG: leucine-rich repeat protein, partial [Paludibacteraceae bacterium]|nr:leucine-rich repeat protein [Paludibacteraceae bacterium]